MKNEVIGLNFSRAKYDILNNNTFVPHVRSNFQAAVPIKMLDNFNAKKFKDPVALVRIKSDNLESFRLKKLSKASNSLIISLKAEKREQNLQIAILDIRPAQELQARTKPIIIKSKVKTTSIFPKFTKRCSWPNEEQRDISPIYLLHYNSKIYAGIRLSRKDLILDKEINLNESAGAAIGLYFAEGGKIAPSFTNSQPTIINMVLEFLERISNIKRKDLKANINCNKDQKYRKRDLEKFWAAQTGIKNFNKLHIGEKVKSPVGVLELNLGSKLLKEFMCGLFTVALKSEDSRIGLIQGILSGDGSPILQHKNYITHHIATDKNHISFQQTFIEELFNDKISTIKKVHAGKIVLYNNWETNYNFLFLDPYKFNIFNRKKFAKQFLNLPTTKFFVNIKNNDTMKGTDIERHYAKYLVKNDYIKLKQIKPKPNRMYIISLTKKGVKKQSKLKEFAEYTYILYLKEIKNFKKLLTKFNLCE
jgi:hypothetical protein